MTDLSVFNGGSIFLLRSRTDVGKQWIEDHIPTEAQWWGGAVAVEHRYIEDIVNGAMDDGLTVSEE